MTEPLLRASDVFVERCDPIIAVRLNGQWHSRLPHAQRGPWRCAFLATISGVPVGVALWHNPSARGLPQNWMELRRMALSPEAPKNSASRMLGLMRRSIQSDFPEIVRLISYQDIAVHSGTIYKAANWVPAYFSKPRLRDRSKPRNQCTGRPYRTDANGPAPAGSGKIRWELSLNGEQIKALSPVPVVQNPTATHREGT